MKLFSIALLVLLLASCGPQRGSSKSPPTVPQTQVPVATDTTPAGDAAPENLGHLNLGPVSIKHSPDAAALSVSVDGTLTFGDEVVGTVSSKGAMVVNNARVAVLNADGTIDSDHELLATIRIDASGSVTKDGEVFMTVDKSGRVSTSSGSQESGLRYAGDAASYRVASFIFIVVQFMVNQGLDS